MKIRNTRENHNILLLAIFAILTLLVLLIRFGELTIAKQSNGVDLVSYDQTHDQNRSSITNAKRGTIFDSSGQPIALDATSYSIYAVLRSSWSDNVVEDVDKTAEALAKHLDLSRDEILDILLNFEASQVEFGTAGINLSPQTKEAIEAENLPGIILVSSTHRQYINDVFASHLIGYAIPSLEANDSQATILEGQIGIEAAYDERLSGEAIYSQQEAEGIYSDSLLGEDIYLTLEGRIQNYLEDLMDQVYNRYLPKELNAYLVELDTGKLLAASQRPTFQLSTREGIETEWRNFIVQESDEPGSTIKILTLAMAKELDLYDDNETFKSGSVEVYDQTVRDYNLYGWGDITFQEGLVHSSNVGMVYLVQRIGLERWVEILEDFGFGQSTESNLPNESSGYLQFDNPVSIMMSGFGQSFSATPMQLMQAYTTIGNEGEMLKIQYLDHIGDRNDSSYEVQSLGQKISPETARYILDSMVLTVEHPEGTARPFYNNDVRIAAKTGTAEIADAENGGYLTGPNDFYHSVVAFYPAEDPQYMVYLSMQQPSQSYGLNGSQILAQIFHPLVEYSLINQ
ncbi:peptidoglycan D,D-transpeptidase FtsI family protein [Fundicoccus culcitae]|uniref:Penicillin-binding protein 2 n=1 Tax=Fundicoccus culcitae TaxID=2969821 RepID=A0ABY5P5L6_9LACT|nr:penicillin-binding protein 2 [Fundicoccus culcitae]UUX34002.1 penicillin-binding protein 2 [Fundicoccus culcitae]